MTMRTGEMAIEVMRVLDEANTPDLWPAIPA